MFHIPGFACVWLARIQSGVAGDAALADGREPDHCRANQEEHLRRQKRLLDEICRGERQPRCLEGA